MSVFETWSTAIRERDADTLAACLHEDYTFVRHQSGTTMNKAEMSEMLRAFMANEKVVVHSQKCLYENDEVFIEHSIMDLRRTESVLSLSNLKDGRIVHTETGRPH